VLVSKFFIHFGVYLEGELYKIIKSTNEITYVTLHKMSFIKVDDHWVWKDDEDGIATLETDNGDEVGPSNTGTNQDIKPMTI